VLRRLIPYLLLSLLAFVFFGNVVLHPTQVLYSDHSDLLEETLPAKCFLARSWQQTGELPLWNPYSYGGMPFIHDVKVGALYPLHMPLYWLPEEHQGAAVTWLVVLHVMIAGWGTYAYGRARGLGDAGSLVAAIGFMFAGKWLLHLLSGGHYFMAPLAWLPFVLLALEPAARRGSLWLATAAGAAFALIVLGSHPQVTFYTGVFIAVWTLGPALESAGYLGGAGPRSLRRTAAVLGRWLACGAWTAAVAVAVSAVELWPAVEATGEATRGLGVAADEAPATAVWMLLHLVGPSLAGAHWEGRGALGLLWLATAALAPVLRRGLVRYDAAVLLGLIVFGLGGGALFQGLPGFNLFQFPSRMLLPAALPLALLAGTAIDSLFAAAPLSAEARRRCRWIFLGVVLVAALLAGGAAVLDFASLGSRLFAPALAWWVLWPLAGAVLFRLLGRPDNRTTVIGIWLVLLLAELWVPAMPVIAVRPQPDVYAPSACVQHLKDTEAGAESVGDARRVLDRGLPDSAATTPLTPGLALMLGIEPLRGYNSLDVRRYKEYLQFVSGSDQPLKPREGPLGFPILRTFPIRNKGLLDLLGATYLLQPADRPADGPGWTPLFDDAAPAAYQVIAGGRQSLPPYALYRNKDVFPRAFVVYSARPLPARDLILPTLASADLRQTVFLEGWQGVEEGPTGQPRTARVVEYQPNRVLVKVDAGPAGYLVLADVWYPGWRCAVDGHDVPLYRGDYLFRAVELPEGEHVVAFTFEPESYRRGRLVSLVALAAVSALLLLGWAANLRRKSVQRSEPAV
jgi:hypothetical protein